MNEKELQTCEDIRQYISSFKHLGALTIMRGIYKQILEDKKTLSNEEFDKLYFNCKYTENELNYMVNMIEERIKKLKFHH